MRIFHGSVNIFHFSVKIKGVMGESEIMLGAGVFNNLKNSRIMEFLYVSISDIDQMIMLFGCQCLLKLGNILPELVLND